MAPALQAAGAVLDYLTETQKASLAHIDCLTPYRVGKRLEIDEATRRSLELTQTLRDGRREGSLLGVMDRTVTSMGARLLGDWLANPLTETFEHQRSARRRRRISRRSLSHHRTSRSPAFYLRYAASAGPRHHRPRYAPRS